MNKNPTIVDHLEVFDSSGTLSLMNNGYDLLYLNVVFPDRADDPASDRILIHPGDANHQKIIDIIAGALTGVRPEPNGATDSDLELAIQNLQKARSLTAEKPIASDQNDSKGTD